MATNNANIGFEKQIWDAACVLRGNIDASEYKSVVLGLIFLKYISDRFEEKYQELLAEGDGFEEDIDEYTSEGIFFVPANARWSVIASKAHTPEIGTVIDDAMRAIEKENKRLKDILPKNFARPELDKRRLGDVVDLFTNIQMIEHGSEKDILGRTYEYCLSKFAEQEGKLAGEFYTPSCVVRTLVEVLQPYNGRVYDPACGSGGMFIQSGDFVNQSGMNANSTMTFFGQEKVEYNAQLCLMNMAVHGLTGVIKSGDEANTFYHDAHNLDGCCDYVMANPPFNVDKVKAESCENAKRLPFGMPGVNKNKEVGNGNYLWISYFYSYLNECGRAGFVMASSATDSQGKDKDIRQKLVETGHVDAMISVGNNFFYTKSLPCSLWFLDKGKREAIKDKVLFIDARNYYTVVDRTLNEWSEWQLKNLNAIVWLYRGETEKYEKLLDEYRRYLLHLAAELKADEICRMITPTTAFADILSAFKDFETEQKQQAKFDMEHVVRQDKKRQQAIWDERLADISSAITVAKEAVWLYEKFGDGVYTDVLGLCKIADMSVIDELTTKEYIRVIESDESKKYSITPDGEGYFVRRFQG